MTFTAKDSNFLKKLLTKRESNEEKRTNSSSLRTNHVVKVYNSNGKEEKQENKVVGNVQSSKRKKQNDVDLSYMDKRKKNKTGTDKPINKLKKDEANSLFAGKKLKKRVSFHDEEAHEEEHQSRSDRLAKSSKARLFTSQFRTINEYLYSHSSDEAHSYMTQQLFDSYHSTYNSLMQKWPIKPTDFIIDKIKDAFDLSLNLTFADLGCGQKALIKQALGSKTVRVHSYDLVSSHEDVIACDISHLPLTSYSCHCVVFSLSLMNTNLKDCLAEANRVLKKKNGRMFIVEVTSRFEGQLDEFCDELKKYGFNCLARESLPPNAFFTYFDFVRVGKCNKDKLDDLTLKPCFYKPR